MMRWRITFDVLLDAATPETARDALYGVTEELRAAVEVSATDVATHDAPLHAVLDAIEEALRTGALDDGTPVLAPDDAIDALDVVERRLIVRALASQGSVARAARCLGLGRNTLYRRLAQHGLDLPSAGAPPRVPPPLPGDFARTSPDAAPSKGDR
jgi:transcriptional regulator with GAF, ATPase, and Fis domain